MQKELRSLINFLFICVLANLIITFVLFIFCLVKIYKPKEYGGYKTITTITKYYSLKGDFLASSSNISGYMPTSNIGGEQCK